MIYLRGRESNRFSWDDDNTKEIMSQIGMIGGWWQDQRGHKSHTMVFLIFWGLAKLCVYNCRFNVFQVVLLVVGKLFAWPWHMCISYVYDFRLPLLLIFLYFVFTRLWYFLVTTIWYFTFMENGFSNFF